MDWKISSKNLERCSKDCPSCQSSDIVLKIDTRIYLHHFKRTKLYGICQNCWRKFRL